MVVRKSWDQYFMDIANVVATRATCDRKHVGCVLVVDKRIVATGYNGSVPGQPHCDDEGHDMHNGHCVRTVHAEVNAVAQAARAGVSTKRAVAYVNTYPCWPCAKVLLTAGVSAIIFDSEYRVDERVEAACLRAGVTLRRLEQQGGE
jgi:dCMP deaminase